MPAAAWAVPVAPLNQLLISAFGWISAMYAMAIAAAATIPLTRLLTGKSTARHADRAAIARPGADAQEQLQIAARDRSYWYLQLASSPANVHVAFLVTHLQAK